MIKTALILTLSASLLAAVPIATTATPPATTAPPPALPLLVRKMLDKKYKGWQLATVAPAGGCGDRMGDSPAIVTADFNSDGFPDWGILIRTSAGVKLLAVMAWQEDFRIFELETSSDATAARFLGVDHRGAKFLNPQTALDDYFANETLFTASCGKDQVAYLWVGFNFIRAVLPG
jgi:hypothetical protein